MPHPVKYTHVYETDIFRKVGNKRVRIRKDKKTNAVVQVCEKVRLGDLNISSPMSKFDWRLSVSTETPSASRYLSEQEAALLMPVARVLPVDYVPEGPDLNMRTKDRLSYAHQIVQVDLTQVSTEVCDLLERRLAL
jgi:polynucleotide 5'-triphosphatase